MPKDSSLSEIKCRLHNSVLSYSRLITYVGEAKKLDRCMSGLAHRVISRPCANSVAFEAKRTFRPCLQNRICESALQVLPLFSLVILRRNHPDQISTVASKTCDGPNDLLDHVVSDREHSRRNDRPSPLAALRLITSSNLESCTTGRSEGFSPLRMRPA